MSTNRKPVWFAEVKGQGGNEFWLGDAIIACLVIGLPAALCLWVGWTKIIVPVWGAIKWQLS